MPPQAHPALVPVQPPVVRSRGSVVVSCVAAATYRSLPVECTCDVGPCVCIYRKGGLRPILCTLREPCMAHLGRFDNNMWDLHLQFT